MPEWSKGSVLSTDVFARVGSNPTPDNVKFYKYFIKFYNICKPPYENNDDKIKTVKEELNNKN